jgi:hypothetical protein
MESRRAGSEVQGGADVGRGKSAGRRRPRRSAGLCRRVLASGTAGVIPDVTSRQLGWGQAFGQVDQPSAVGRRQPRPDGV